MYTSANLIILLGNGDRLPVFYASRIVFIARKVALTALH